MLLCHITHYLQHYLTYSLRRTRSHHLNNMDINILNWSLGVLATVGTGYGVWMNRKSKRFKEAEEGDKFIESAVKLTDIWGKLSEHLQLEIAELRKEGKEVMQKYMELKIDFDVTKAKSDFVIEQLKLENERIKAENERLSSENSSLREQLGVGIVKKMG